MLITDEDREWIDTRADQLFRESERQRGGIRPNTVMPQDYRDYFVVQAAWERAADALIEAERRGAERMRERAATEVEASAAIVDHPSVFMGGPSRNAQRIANSFAKHVRDLPLTKETRNDPRD